MGLNLSPQDMSGHLKSDRCLLALGIAGGDFAHGGTRVFRCLAPMGKLSPMLRSDAEFVGQRRRLAPNVCAWWSYMECAV